MKFVIGALSALFAATLPVYAAAPTAPASPIQHVVVLYMENHSFDNTLGFWCASTLRCNGMPATTHLRSGASVTPSTAADLVLGVNHSVASQVAAIDSGAMDGWASVPGCAAKQGYGCISGYQPTQIPNLTGLANRFAVSDATFSMADSPSWGGHVYVVAATNDHFTGDNPTPPNPKPAGWVHGPGWGCNSNLVVPWINPATGAKSFQPSCIPDFSLSKPNGGAFQPTLAAYVPTIMDELNSAGLAWRIYAPGKTASRGVCPSFAECQYTAQLGSDVPTGNLLSDAAAGRLPAFGLVIPDPTHSQHNGYSMATGDNWIGQQVAALEAGPQWSSTAVFVTYDDCGCFYDHVTPGTNPDGTQQGIRMPVVIVSPYAKAGYTDSTPTTIAGILAFTEANYGLAPLSANDAAAYGFANAFDYSQPPITAPFKAVTQVVKATVPGPGSEDDAT